MNQFACKRWCKGRSGQSSRNINERPAEIDEQPRQEESRDELIRFDNKFPFNGEELSDLPGIINILFQLVQNVFHGHGQCVNKFCVWGAAFGSFPSSWLRYFHAFSILPMRRTLLIWFYCTDLSLWLCYLFTFFSALSPPGEDGDGYGVADETQDPHQVEKNS